MVLLGPEIRALANRLVNNLSSALEDGADSGYTGKDGLQKAGGGVKGLTMAIGTATGEGLLGAGKGRLNLSAARGVEFLAPRRGGRVIQSMRML